MFFKKKKKMIDIAEMQRRGLIRTPKKEVEIETNKDGFVEVEKSKTSGLSFLNNSSSILENDSKTGDLLKRLSGQISDLDNKLYKLEQRIELLEKKAGVGDFSGSVIGW